MRVTAILLVCAIGGSSANLGILDLDNTTFDRVIGGATPALVRFDKEYSYGDADDAWREVGKAIGKSDAKLFICDVSIAEPASPYQNRGEYNYGEDSEPPPDEDEDPTDAWRDNQDLAARYGVSLETMPQFVYFPQGPNAEPKTYEGPHTQEAILQFLQERARVWVGLPGQEQRLHEAAQKFLEADAEARAEIIASIEGGEKSETSPYYLKVMKKMAADDEFIGKEVKRLRKMMDDSSLSQKKRDEFSRRLNALSSFGSR